MKEAALKYRPLIAIFLVWLFHLSGIAGIWLGYGEWFISLTPLNLLICLLLVIWEMGLKRSRILIVPFFIGMLAEILGVNFGWIFGDYAYGANLGPKILGVPWMIGVNWALLVYASHAVVSFLPLRFFTQTILSAVLMVVLDVFMEINAPALDFWQFNGGVVPLQNYAGWLVVSWIAHIFYKLGEREDRAEDTLGVHLFFAFLVFFVQFLFLPQ